MLTQPATETNLSESLPFDSNHVILRMPDINYLQKEEN
jgi:hypothetical protein